MCEVGDCFGRETVRPGEEEEGGGGEGRVGGGGRSEVCRDKEELARCTETQSALVMTTAPCR